MSKVRFIINYEGKEVFSEVVEGMPSQVAGNFLDFPVVATSGQTEMLRGEIRAVATRPAKSGTGLTTVMCWIVDDPKPQVVK